MFYSKIIYTKYAEISIFYSLKLGFHKNKKYQHTAVQVIIKKLESVFSYHKERYFKAF